MPAHSSHGLTSARQPAGGWRGSFLLLLSGLGLFLTSVSTVRAAEVRLVHPPEAYIYRARYGRSRKVFPGRTVIHQSGYRGGDDGLAGMIVMTELADTTSQHGVEEAQDALRELWGNDTHHFAVLSTTEIDGQSSWYWFERDKKGQRLVAVVPYLDVTYTIEFESTEARWQNDLAMLEVVTSFERGGSGAGKTAVPLVGVALFAGMVLLWRRMQ